MDFRRFKVMVNHPRYSDGEPRPVLAMEETVERTFLLPGDDKKNL